MRDIDGAQIEVGRLPDIPEGMEVARVDVIVRLRRKKWSHGRVNASGWICSSLLLKDPTSFPVSLRAQAKQSKKQRRVVRVNQSPNWLRK